MDMEFKDRKVSLIPGTLSILIDNKMASTSSIFKPHVQMPS